MPKNVRTKIKYFVEYKLSIQTHMAILHDSIISNSPKTFRISHQPKPKTFTNLSQTSIIIHEHTHALIYRNAAVLWYCFVSLKGGYQSLIRRSVTGVRLVREKNMTKVHFVCSWQFILYHIIIKYWLGRYWIRTFYSHFRVSITKWIFDDFNGFNVIK